MSKPRLANVSSLAGRLVVVLVIGIGLLLVLGCEEHYTVKRYGFIAPVKHNDLKMCRALFTQEKPGLVGGMDSANISNASMYLGQVDTETYYAFSYYEYKGGDFQADLQKAGLPAFSGKTWSEGDLLPGATQNGRWMEMEEVFHFDGDPAPYAKRQRFGSVLGIEKKDILAYKQLHIAVWPQVLKTINDCNLRNFSIFLGEVEKDKFYLFCYYEYIGDDLEADGKRNGEDEVTRLWWTYTEPLQRPVPTRKQGEWWHVMEELVHVK